MKKIGFNTTALVCEIGNKYEVMYFFKCIKENISNNDVNNIDLVSDRLFRKYVRFEDIESTLDVLRKVRSVFDVIPYGGDFEFFDGVCLNLNGKTLSDVFCVIFNSAEKVFDQAIMFYRDFNRYTPIKLIVADIPECISWEKKSLAEYDSVSGEPLWYLFG